MSAKPGALRRAILLTAGLALVSLVSLDGIAISHAASTPPAGSGPAPTSSAPAAANPPICSDANAFVRSHPGWVCTFDDEFDRSTHDAHNLNRAEWLPQLTSNSGFRTGPPAHPACYIDDRHNIWVSQGRLHLRVRALPKPFNCATADGLSPYLIHDGDHYRTRYTAGSVSTFARFAQEYGRFAVRARIPKTQQPGLHEALWLWPSHPRRYGMFESSGEIDFAEFYSNFARRVIPYIHYLLPPGNYTSTSYTNAVTARCPIHWGKFNTYVANWKPGIIRLSVNGQTCLINRYHALNVAPPAPFNQPFIIALTQGLGVTGNAFNPRATPLPATTQIDWVRVWKRG